MAPVLDDLLNDNRLTRLFSKNSRPCALQLWILQIKSDQSIENRIVYGRLLPYSHFSQRWSSTDDDNFYDIGQVQGQVIRLNLYLKSDHCVDLLRKLSGGQTVSEISEELELELSDKLKVRFGATSLPADALVYRPVVYLLNRDAFDLSSTSSPHGTAGAFSASITQTNKGDLFRLSEGYDTKLTALVVKRLNEDTGLDFGGTDNARFGDLELLVFPSLDDLERPLLSVNWTNPPRTLVAQFNPMQLPHFSGFQFHLSIANDGQIAYSGVAIAERNTEGMFECKFDLNEQLRARTDRTELEIFGFYGDHFREGTLCCRWRVGYIREIHFQTHLAGHGTSPVKFDWLEKTTQRSSMSARVKAALTINRSNLEFTNRIGGREADPWVPANRDLKSLFERLHPPKSEGRFFQRWSQGDGEGRLQFVEWFKALLEKYQHHQVVIFDPYFDEAGLGLVLLYAAQNANYIIFTSLGDPNKPTPDRINNLVANCEQNSHRSKHIRLRLLGLKKGRLHDRYILIIGSDGLPVEGFNLSNSLQVAAEKYPLLATPIPADTLLDVEHYKSELIKEAGHAATPDSETENPSMRLLFDSTKAPTVPRRYEPLRIFEKAQAGDVLSVWIGNPSLRGLSGDRLKEQMVALNLLENDSLSMPKKAGLRNFLAQQEENFSDFASTWEIIGELLAHSWTEDTDFSRLASAKGFLEFLVQFLKASFNRANDYFGKELALMDPHLFRESLETLLHRPYHLHSLSSPTKYAALTWAEYFTIKLLWKYVPDTLLAIVETQVAEVPMEPQNSDAVRLSLLSQIVSEVSLSVQFSISKEQRDRLISSSNGLLQWMGLNAIEMQLEKPGGLTTVLRLMSTFTYPERVRALGWMVHHMAGIPEKAEIYKGLVEALHEALPATISAEDLKSLVNSMRGHMCQLAWTEPWLFQDVVHPLLQNNRANIDDACEIWVQELAALLEPELKQKPSQFHLAHEGQTTNITAFLFAYSSHERQQTSLKLIQTILQKQKRVIQQPLASTLNWNRWDGALVVSMWILTFTRWAQYYLSKRGTTNLELESLLQKARELAMVRPMDDWLSQRHHNKGQLAAFLEQVEELISIRTREDQQEL